MRRSRGFQPHLLKQGQLQLAAASFRDYIYDESNDHIPSNNLSKFLPIKKKILRRSETTYASRTQSNFHTPTIKKSLRYAFGKKQLLYINIQFYNYV